VTIIISSRRLGRLSLALALASCGWSACSPPSRLAAKEPPSIVPPPGGSAAASGKNEAQWTTTRYWVAGCSAPDDLWKYRKGSSTVTCDPRGRTLASTNGKLVWADYLIATDVDTLLLEGEGLESLRFELSWSTDDDFAPSRTVSQALATGATEIRFVLSKAPEWRGLVRRFRLTWSGDPPAGSRIVAAWGKKRTAVVPPSR
jgi:hypothetical protein